MQIALHSKDTHFRGNAADRENDLAFSLLHRFLDWSDKLDNLTTDNLCDRLLRYRTECRRERERDDGP